MAQISPYLDYLNRVHHSNPKITSIQQLSDGIAMHQIISRLKQFQSSYSYEIITHPTTFIHRMKNIKSLIKAIHHFWTIHVHQEVCYEIDAIKIAKNYSHKEIQKLIRLLVKTLFQSKDKLFFIEKVLETSQETQQFFMDLVKEQTSIQFTSPKTSKSAKNYHESLYDRLLELEHQNEHLVELMEDLISQNQEYAQKQKDFEEKLSEKQVEIRRLNWALNEMNEKKYKPQESDLSGSRQKMLQEMISQKIREIEEREKGVIMEVQKSKEIIKSQAEQLKKYMERLDSLKIESTALNQQKIELQISLSEWEQKAQNFQNQIKDLNEYLNIKSTQIISHKDKIEKLENQLSSKAQQIDELQINIRYLQQQKDQTPFRSRGNSIRDDCNNISQPVIVRKKRQTDKVNKELRSALLTITKQQKEIQRLRLCDEENKKLVQIISHMQNYRGQENQVLVRCLYKMRTKILEKELKNYQNNPRNPLGEICLND